MLLRGIISENYVNQGKLTFWHYIISRITVNEVTLSKDPLNIALGKISDLLPYSKKIHTYHYNCLLYSTQQQQHMNCGRKINIMYTKEFLLAVTNVSVGRQQQASRQDVKQDKEKITC